MSIRVEWGGSPAIQGLVAAYAGYMNAKRAAQNQERLARYQSDAANSQMIGDAIYNFTQPIGNAVMFNAQNKAAMNNELASFNQLMGPRLAYQKQLGEQQLGFDMKRDAARNTADMNERFMSMYGVDPDTAEMIGRKALTSGDTEQIGQLLGPGFDPATVGSLPPQQLSRLSRFVGSNMIASSQSEAQSNEKLRYQQSLMEEQATNKLLADIAANRVVGPPDLMAKMKDLDQKQYDTEQRVPDPARRDVIRREFGRKRSELVRGIPPSYFKPAEPPDLAPQLSKIWAPTPDGGSIVAKSYTYHPAPKDKERNPLTTQPVTPVEFESSIFTDSDGHRWQRDPKNPESLKPVEIKGEVTAADYTKIFNENMKSLDTADTLEVDPTKKMSPEVRQRKAREMTDAALRGFEQYRRGGSASPQEPPMPLIQNGQLIPPQMRQPGKVYTNPNGVAKRWTGSGWTNP